jgi:transglutaminase-like putative cysteine protease
LAVGGSDDHSCDSAAFLDSTDVVDWCHPSVRTLAWMLASGIHDPVAIARRSFEWVRDEIRHSVDAGDAVVTCAASEVLAQRTGVCYAKSHLLAALLRANGIPSGFCYQRLSIDGVGPPFCLHGLVAVHLKSHGWYRIDPRGDRPGIETRFAPPEESLAFAPRFPGEVTLPEVLSEPLPVVAATLRRYSSVGEVLGHLPDSDRPDDRLVTVRRPHFSSLRRPSEYRL